jgi:hypothetical protein
MTVTVEEAVLLAGFGSGVVAVTVAVLVIGPGVDGRLTVRAMVALPLPLIVPSEQVTVDVPLHEPWLGVAETNVVPGGRTSDTDTPFAGAEAVVFVTVIVQVIGRPVPYGAADGVFVTERSADGTFVDAVALLLFGLGSLLPDETVAVLLMLPGVVVCTVSVNCVLAPAANVGTVQFTVPVAPTAGVVQLNAGPLWDRETKVVPAGSGSFMATVVASLGPALLTVMV